MLNSDDTNQELEKPVKHRMNRRSNRSEATQIRRRVAVQNRETRKFRRKRRAMKGKAKHERPEIK